MRIIEILGEKVNPNVTFEYQENTEHENRGWVIDKITAFLDGKQAGYLKIENIPRKNFEHYYPSILNYLKEIKGLCVLPYGYETKRVDEIPILELRKNVVYAAMSGYDYVSGEEQKRLSDLTWDQVMEFYKKLEHDMKKKHGTEFRHFETYHVDKPFVSYIHVNDDMRRQGIGTALYRAGYEWMKSRGLRFYASRTQSDLAQAAWKKMRKEYPIKSERIPDKFMRGKKITRKYFAG